MMRKPVSFVLFSQSFVSICGVLCCCREKWEKKNIRFHNNGTVTFNQEKIYVFDESQSVGLEDDVVVVPNIPMLVSDY